MLCESCAEYFSFSSEDFTTLTLGIKRDAVRWAEAAGDEQRIALSSAERDRYESLKQDAERQSVETGKKVLFPKPWPSGRKQRECFGARRGWSIIAASSQTRTFSSLQSAAGSGCELCQIVAAMLEYGMRGETLGDSLEIWCKMMISAISGEPVELNFGVDEMLGRSEMKIRFPIKTEDVDQDQSEEERHVSANTPPSASSTAADECFDFLKRCLTMCEKEHGNSCQNSHSELGWMPNRLLDVLASPDNPGFVRLVERDELSATTASSYATLSHAWGQHRPWMLTQANKEAMKKGFLSKTLPLCFHDAVEITRKLDVRYLWIDALCIMQDCEDDWAAAVLQMDQVYLDGAFNIAACDVTGAYDSMFWDRNPSTGQNIVYWRRYMNSETAKFTLVPDWVSLVRSASPLSRRGWVVQERMLSARTISYSLFLSWSCSLDVVAEGHSWSHTDPKHGSFLTIVHPEKLRVDMADTAADAVGIWWNAVQKYARCDLTVSRDKLIAIAGVAKYASSYIDRPYYAGVWGGEYLIPGLLWRADSGPHQRPHEYRAPSWSWASLDGSIAAQPYSISDVERELVRIRSVKTTPTSSGVFGQVSAGQIVLFGHIVKMPDFENVSSEFKNKWFDEDRTSDPNVPIFFLPMLLISHNQPHCRLHVIAGLLLQMKDRACHDESRRQTAERIGMFTAHELGGGPSDKLLWGELLKTVSSEEEGEEIVLV